MMDETEVLLYLDNPSYNKREQALDQLRRAVRTNSSGPRKLPFSDPVTLFQSLSLALTDTTWETRYQCTKLISELVPVLGADLDQCMQLVLPQLVSLLAHSKVTLSNAASQALNAYANYTYDFQLVLHGIIRHGIEARDTTIKKSVIKSISFLLTEDHKDRNLAALVESLVERLCDNSIIDNDVQESIQFALEKIADLVGQERFDAYFESLSDSLRERYRRLAGKEADRNGDSSHFHSEVVYTRRPMPVSASNSASSLSHVPLDSTMMYGIVPEHIVTRLSIENSGTDQIKAIEELKRVVRDRRNLNMLLPHLGAFLDFLKKILDDKPGIVTKTIMALEIVEILVDRLGVSVEDYLRQVCSAVTKQMPETNISVRSLIMRIALHLMQILPPRTVLPFLLENLSHKNHHVRLVTLNVIIASLLTHPSNDFDLGRLCQALVHTLIDPKKLVRQASLECFAVIAQAMGTGKQQQLIAAVDSLEQTSDADGVMAAVQARLARRQLPTFSNNTVEYATQAALNASRDGSGGGGGGVQMMVDIDWILSGSNSCFPSGRPGPWDSFDKQSMSSGASSGRIWTRVSSEDQLLQSRYSERALKSGTMSKVSDNGKPLRHHNSAQFPLRGSERSPDRGLRGRGSVLDFWELDSSIPLRQSSPPPPPPAASGLAAHHNPPSHPGSTNPRMTLSMTWPSTQLFQDYANDPPPPPDPILRNSGSGSLESDFHPFHTKPMPVRTQSSSRKAAAGSLPLNLPSSAPFSENQIVGNGNRFPETAKAEDDVVEAQDEMNNSLKQIRHSASRKQLNKFFEKQESRESLRRASQQKAASQEDKESMDKTDKGGTSDVVSESLGLNQAPRKRVTGPVVSSYYHPDNSSTSEFNPLSGVTFRDNPNSDVAVVGRGYTADDDANPLLSIHRSSPAMMHAKRNKDRRRFSKAVPLSPLDSSGLPLYGSSSYDGLAGPVGIVGKGLPPSVATDSLAHSPSYPDGGPSQNNFASLGDERPIRPTRQGQTVKVSASLPSAVYGSAVKSEIASSSNYESEYLSSDASTVSSRSIYERNDRQRIGGGRQLVGRKHPDAERSNNPHQLQRIHSKERRQSHPSANGDAGGTEAGIDEADGDTANYIRVKSSTTADTGFEDGLVDEMPPRQPKRRQKRKKQHDLETLKMSSYLDDDDDNIENTAALGNPVKGLNQALLYLTQEHWEVKLKGLSLIRRLAFHHQEVLVPDLGHVVLTVCAEVKNLRSRVSCEAIVCLSDMFTHLKKSLDVDLDRTVAVLLSKTGDQSNQFMREEAEKALVAMVENVTAQKAVSSLITGGASSRSVHIRTVTAQMLERVVDRLGPEKVLGGNREMSDKILPISAQFLQDASPNVRYSGQRIFHILMFHQDFDRVIKKTISETLLRSIQDKLEAVRQKGPTDSGLGSSRTRRTPMIESRGSNRGGSAPVNSVDGGSLPPVNSTFSASSAGKKKTGPGRVDDTTFAEIQSMELNLSSTNWRERCNGVEQLQQLAEANPAALSSHLTKVFSKYIPCLHDSNVKLNLYALQVLNIITPSIARPLASSAVLNLTVQTVVSNLASKNEEIFTTTSAVLDGFENYIDPVLLLAPFISEAKKGKATIKSEMTMRISGLISKIDQRRINQALAQILPFIWHLLSQLITNTGGGRLRAPATQLVNNMQQLMGESGLTSAAKNASTVTLPMQELLQELLLEVA